MNLTLTLTLLCIVVASIIPFVVITSTGSQCSFLPDVDILIDGGAAGRKFL